MGPISQALGPLQGRVPVQVHKAPVVASRNHIFGMISIDSIDMVSAGCGGENALDPPPQFDGVSGPLLIPELSGPTLDLLAGCGLEEKILICSAVALNVLAIS